MAFNATAKVEADTVIITMRGELDAAAAPVLRDLVDKNADSQTRRLVLMTKDLEYIASAGIRVLVFAKQKMGAHVDIYVIGAQPQVMDTLEKTGVNRSVILQDTY
jgi:anti-anti-sigma factor